ncbi:MAG: ATP-dependent metallopeptidase FtsH/Yme1/Tma family protein, partial [Pseudomonadota bacterium]
MGNAKNFAFWAVAILLIVALFNIFQDGASRSAGQEIAFSDFLKQVENKQVAEVVIDGERVTGRTTSGQSFVTYQPLGADITTD